MSLLCPFRPQPLLSSATRHAGQPILLTRPLLRHPGGSSAGARRSSAHVVCGRGFGELMGLNKKVGGKKKGKGTDLPPWEESNTCPCGSKVKYADCCKPYHDGALPETPELLMRSRFSAYAKGIVDYVCATTHPDNDAVEGSWYDDKQVSTFKEDVRATADKIAFHKLKVLDTEDGATPDEGFVTFRYWFKIRGQMGQRQKGSGKLDTATEKSKFLRVDGKWLYLEGDTDYGYHSYEKDE